MNTHDSVSWGRAIVHTLWKGGVSYFALSPGFRSTPLVLGLESLTNASVVTHFDERGLAFHALGVAKATRQPVAIIVTSGTAVANLLPAVIEAHTDRVPIVIVTADRPSELRECGANQTCDQVKFFTPFTRLQLELLSVDNELSLDYLTRTVAYVLAHATAPLPGPVHLNCMFREPLTSPNPLPQTPLPTIHIETSHLHPPSALVQTWAKRFANIERGIILCGSDHLPYTHTVLEFAQRLQWPIFPDILSPLRGVGEHPLLISSYDAILANAPQEPCDAIVQFGNRFVSQSLTHWQKKQKVEFYLHLSEHSMRQDPGHCITHRLQTDPILFCQNIIDALPPKTTTWPLFWHAEDKRVRQQLNDCFAHLPSRNEPGIFHTLATLPPIPLFIGNSMPIRDANQFFLPSLPCGPIFGNRGVSGIDGCIATAIGIAQGLKSPVLAVLGDLSCLHDLNSLAQLTKTSYPLILLIVNNGGGGIFSLLPVAQHQEIFEEKIALAHTLDFRNAAKLFNLPYFLLEDLSELNTHLKNPHSCILEFQTSRQENVWVHQQLSRL